MFREVVCSVTALSPLAFSLGLLINFFFSFVLYEYRVLLAFVSCAMVIIIVMVSFKLVIIFPVYFVYKFL